jgi:hypothetical protein
VITIWVTYVLAAVAASCVFILAGWRSKKPGDATAPRGGNGPLADPLWAEADLDLAEGRSQADAAAALRLAVKRLAPIMANHGVQAEIAAPSGLLVRMRGAALTDLLEEMLVATIRAAPASRLLLTTAARGERIAISITDDLPDADPAVRRAGVRALREHAAMRGGSLDVEVRPNEGTTTTLRLTAVRETEDLAASEPAKAGLPPFFSARATSA